MMKFKTFAIDVDSCSGCGLCVVACKDEHVGSTHAPWAAAQPAVDHFWMRLEYRETGTIPHVSVAHFPVMCQHCTNAPCIAVCDEGAIKRRDDGLVWIDPELCTGCGDCHTACPYGVIYRNEADGIAQKCTGCAHRVDQGLEPRCVEICPHDAVIFGHESTLTIGNGDLEELHPEFGTQPLVKWKGLPTRSVSGLVVDRVAGDVVPDATVTVVDLVSGQVSETSTDAFGDFNVSTLSEHHSYRITVGKDGFDDVRIVLGATSEEYLGEIELQQESTP